jgi:hypothetical protein
MRPCFQEPFDVLQKSFNDMCKVIVGHTNQVISAVASRQPVLGLVLVDLRRGKRFGIVLVDLRNYVLIHMQMTFCMGTRTHHRNTSTPCTVGMF